MKVEWGLLKGVLLFLGLLTKSLATLDPLPFPWGDQVKAISAVIWPAFDGAFMWLLKPPKQKEETDVQPGTDSQEP